MKRIVYSSAAKGTIDEPTLADIHNVARLRNARRDISGMLLYRDGVFLQLLEGSVVEVDMVLASIRKDPRHHRVTILVDEKVTTRSFPSWSMGYRALNSRDCATTGAVPKPMRDIARDAPYALTLLLRFAGDAAMAPLAATQTLRRAALQATDGRP